MIHPRRPTRDREREDWKCVRRRVGIKFGVPLALGSGKGTHPPPPLISFSFPWGKHYRDQYEYEKQNVWSTYS
jgi:hypothetical protein